MKPKGTDVAAAAVQAVSVGYTYDEMDCQTFIEHCARQAGGTMDYLGTNDMARRAAWLGTLSDARAQGRLVPGAGLLIREETDANLPARYAGDGLGDFSHVGLYVGENALTDVDKNGNARSCDVVHSSATMKRVAGSTLKNGWTHVMWFPEIDYGADVQPGVEIGAEISQETPVDANGAEGGLTAGTPAASAERYATVVSPDGNPVKLRKSASQKEPVYWKVNPGARVLVEREKDGWALITAVCSDGYVRRAYMMSQFLRG
jgi:hypothetical protein